MLHRTAYQSPGFTFIFWLEQHVGTPPGSVGLAIVDADVIFEPRGACSRLELELLVVFQINSSFPLPAPNSFALSASSANSKFCFRGRELLELKFVRLSFLRNKCHWCGIKQGKGRSTE